MAITNSDGSIILKTKVDTSGIKAGTDSINAMAKKIGKYLAVAFSVKKVYDFVKASVDAFADYEQLVGGVETLFKNSSKKVLGYAEEAYKTAGLSANEYMQNVTAFSASLLDSLGGDTEQAAEVANDAIISISDNVNKMGSDYASVQNAFQGFAKQQYMLLDNLKLGYGGTKTEMERLLKDAEAYRASMGETVSYEISNLADVYTAIGDIQKKLDIAGTTAKEAETTISGSAATMKASWKNLLTYMSVGGGKLDSSIKNLVDSVAVYMNNLLPVVEKAMLGIAVMIEKIAPMLVERVASALIKAIPVLIYSIYKMIIGLANGIYEGIKALFFGKAVEFIEEQTDGIAESAENQKVLTDEVKNTEKALKKTLAGFDDLQILTSGASEESELSEAIQNSFDSISGVGGEEATGTDELTGIAEKVKSAIESLLPIIEIGLVAIGLILLAMGNIPFGIGFIVAGAYLYSVSERAEGSFSLDVVKDDLQKLSDYLEEILVVIGIILLFLGQIPWGIGFIIAGAVVYAVKETKSKEYNTASFKTKLAVIANAVSLSLSAIGVMLIFYGQIPLGIGFIIAGAVGLNVSEAQIEEGEVTTKTEKFFKKNQDLIVGVGLALLVIGIILCATGVGFSIALGLIMAGAGLLATEETINKTKIQDDIKKFFENNAGIITGLSIALLVIGVLLCATGVALEIGISLIVGGVAGLVTEVALNWDTIKNKIDKFFKDCAGLIVGVSIALIILGIILCFTVSGIPIGIALILAGVAGLVTVVAVNKDAILNWIKNVWGSIVDFWNNNIAKYFTKKFWLELIGKAGEGIKSGFKGIINSIIEFFENSINWIVDKFNEISFDVPDWVPGIGGETFGFDITRANFPRLARGAVIPPNREFLAVLGDQKQGVNIEAPLQTIVDAFNIALAQNGANFGGGNTEVVLEIDGREFGRAVVEQGDKESRRIGTKLVIA